MIIAPSLLAANWKKIKTEIKEINQTGAQWIHFDVMDGQFVPAFTYTPAQLQIIKKATNLFLDVHLMVANPCAQATLFAQAGADLITFHYEATADIAQTIKHIKKLQCQVGIAIKPATPVALLKPFLKDINVVLVMSVEPGKGGQKFLPTALSKIKYLKKCQNQNQFLIAVDGGINDQTGSWAQEAGANVLVAGSYIFGHQNYQRQVSNLQNE